MIKINVNGNRSDIIGYVSYYSSEEIANLLDIKQEEIIYETTVVDYFLHGDITFDTDIIVHVTITDNYFDKIQELTNIIVKYVGYFTNKCKVYYDVIDSRLVYVYEAKGKKQHDEHHCCCGHHHEEEHCGCGHHHEEHCECGCEEGHECHCHEDHECHCCEGEECTCGDTCHCGDNCTCDDDCKCHEHECNCHKE